MGQTCEWEVLVIPEKRGEVLFQAAQAVDQSTGAAERLVPARRVPETAHHALLGASGARSARLKLPSPEVNSRLLTSGAKVRILFGELIVRLRKSPPQESTDGEVSTSRFLPRFLLLLAYRERAAKCRGGVFKVHSRYSTLSKLSVSSRESRPGS